MLCCKDSCSEDKGLVWMLMVGGISLPYGTLKMQPMRVQIRICQCHKEVVH